MSAAVTEVAHLTRWTIDSSSFKVLTGFAADTMTIILLKGTAPLLPRTHTAIDPRLCGTPVALEPGTARVELETVPEMAADERGLVHGGFVFGLADYAAMLAVNHPHVVLGSAQTRYLKPVVVGERLLAAASLLEEDGRKRRVAVEVRRGDRGGDVVMTGELLCFVPDRHVLETKA
jgi:acyl-coenzyme A thioesterase PaaI-like protein